MKLLVLNAVVICSCLFLLSCGKETSPAAVSSVVAPLTTSTTTTGLTVYVSDATGSDNNTGIDKATGTLLSTSDRRDQSRSLDGDGKAVSNLGALEYKP